jgi:hypothetical protein
MSFLILKEHKESSRVFKEFFQLISSNRCDMKEGKSGYERRCCVQGIKYNIYIYLAIYRMIEHNFVTNLQVTNWQNLGGVIIFK